MRLTLLTVTALTLSQGLPVIADSCPQINPADIFKAHKGLLAIPHGAKSTHVTLLDINKGSPIVGERSTALGTSSGECVYTTTVKFKTQPQ